MRQNILILLCYSKYSMSNLTHSVESPVPWFAVGFQQPLKHLLRAQSANIPKATAKTPRFSSWQWTLPFSCPPHFMQPTRVKKYLTWQTCLEVQSLSAARQNVHPPGPWVWWGVLANRELSTPWSGVLPTHRLGKAGRSERQYKMQNTVYKLTASRTENCNENSCEDTYLNTDFYSPLSQ